MSSHIHNEQDVFFIQKVNLYFKINSFKRILFFINTVTDQYQIAYFYPTVLPIMLFPHHSINSKM